MCISSFSQSEIKPDPKVVGVEYSGYLNKFGETTLSDKNTNTYRVLVWPTFYNPILFTLSKSQDKLFIKTVILNGEGGYQPSGIKRSFSRRVSRDEFLSFERLLSRHKIYELKRSEDRWEPKNDGSAEICLDGALWYFESNRMSEYFLLKRYCPEDKAVTEAGFYLLRLSGMKKNRRELF